MIACLLFEVHRFRLCQVHQTELHGGCMRPSKGLLYLEPVQKEIICLKEHFHKVSGPMNPLG